MMGDPVYRLRTDVVHRSLDDEHYLLSADSAFHTVSDPVGAFVLASIQGGGGLSLDALVAAVCREFDASETEVRRDVSSFLQALVAGNVLERDPA